MGYHFLHSPYRTIYENLALEQQLARSIRPDEKLLLLWVDAPAVVYGRFQNPWSEFSPKLLAQQGIQAARRASGGGTVYHDPGNLNYSVITPRNAFDAAANLAALVSALKGAGLSADIGPRKDLWVAGQKVSGSAFQLHKDFAVHHGTLLIDADLGRLHDLLRSPFRITESRAVASVPSPVTNIGPLTGIREAPPWFDRLTEAFGNQWQCSLTPYPESLPPAVTAAERQRLSSWDWLYGQTPDFMLHPTEDSPIALRVEGGRITAVDTPDSQRSRALTDPPPLTFAGLNRLMAHHPQYTPFITELMRELESPAEKEVPHAF